MTHAPRYKPRAFTLIETSVVIMFLSIVMSVALPRLMGQERREIQAAEHRVRDLLMMFAQREALSGTPVGIWHDAQRNWIVLVMLEETGGEGTDSARWRPDHAVRPVELPRNIPVNGVRATADGRPIDIRRWPIASEPGRMRPTIEITMQADDGQTRTLILPSYAITPYALEDGSELAALRVPIDLDSAGRRREDW
jgi:type II secretory pathway pseudopilin PulG